MRRACWLKQTNKNKNQVIIGMIIVCWYTRKISFVLKDGESACFGSFRVTRKWGVSNLQEKRVDSGLFGLIAVSLGSRDLPLSKERRLYPCWHSKYRRIGFLVGWRKTRHHSQLHCSSFSRSGGKRSHHYEGNQRWFSRVFGKAVQTAWNLFDPHQHGLRIRWRECSLPSPRPNEPSQQSTFSFLFHRYFL